MFELLKAAMKIVATGIYTVGMVHGAAMGLAVGMAAMEFEKMAEYQRAVKEAA